MACPGAASARSSLSAGHDLSAMNVTRIDVNDLPSVMAWYGRHKMGGSKKGEKALHSLREGPRWAECSRCDERLEMMAEEGD